MAVQNTKRRRVEDEVRRPRKKIRKIKKQKHYHSSSEDEDEDETEQIAAVKPDIQANKGSAKILEKKNKSQSRSALKSKAVKQPEIVTSLQQDQIEDAEEHIEENDEEHGLNELEVNTALNLNPRADSESDLDAESLDGLEDDEPTLDNEDDDILDRDDGVEVESDDESPDGSEAESTNPNKIVKKRNDPNAFATSISKILTTKLTTQKRSDPILSRSKTAEEANKAIADSKLSSKARASIRAEKKALLEKGRVKDVLGLETTGVDTGAILEEEKRLKKTAQRGVVKLFNAVRAAQVKAEEGQRQQKEQNVIGMQKREEKVNELSKEGFLDLLSRGGKSEAVQA